MFIHGVLYGLVGSIDHLVVLQRLLVLFCVAAHSHKHEDELQKCEAEISTGEGQYNFDEDLGVVYRTAGRIHSMQIHMKAKVSSKRKNRG